MKIAFLTMFETFFFFLFSIAEVILMEIFVRSLTLARDMAKIDFISVV
jgi:hypothetical protein